MAGYDPVGYMANLLNTQANTADMQAQAQERLANAVLLRNQAQVQQNLRDAFAETMMPDDSAIPSGTRAPGAESQNLGKVSDTGSSFDMNDPLAVSYGAAQRAMVNNQRLAQIYRKAGSYGEAEKYDALVQQGQTNLREIVSKIYDKQQTQAKDAAQVMQGVLQNPNQDALESAVSYIARNFPRSTVQKVLSGIPFDEETGKPIMGTQAMRAVANLQNQYTSGHEKATEAQAASTLEETKARDKQSHEDRVMTQNREDARAAATRSLGYARLKEMEKRTALMGDLRDEKEVRQIEKDAQGDLNKMELVKNFDKSGQAFLAAKNVTRQMEAGGLRDTSAPDIQNMVRGYDQMINNFRSFMGGKWSAQQDEQMQGTLQKIRAYWTTIGQGKKPDSTLVRDIAAEIARVHQDTNAKVLQRTLELRARVAQKGGDPTTVISPAQQSEAIRTKRADIVTDPKDGQQYMAFHIGKDKPDKEDVVPIYDKPVRRRPGNVYLFPDEEE